MGLGFEFVPIRDRSPQHVVLEYMAAIAAEERSGTKVLDLPAGHGSVSFPLAFGGFDVTACDLFPDRARAMAQALAGDADVRRQARRDLPIPATLRPRLLPGSEGPDSLRIDAVRGDMEEALPFPDQSFDVVLSIEGIEHVVSQLAFIREARRVLSAGGTLVLTTPNTLCLRSRMAYACVGNRTLRTMIDEYMSTEAQEAGRLYHGHVFIPNYFQLRYMLHHGGFRIRRLHASRFSPSSVLLWPFMMPAVAWFTWRDACRWTRKFRQCTDRQRVPPGAEPPYGEILRHTLSKALLLCGAVIIEAEAV